MWTSTSMTLLESLVVSGMGITIVLSVLSLLAVSIILFSKVMGAASAKPKAAPPVEQKQDDGVEEEECALIVSVICEELRTAPENIIITSIQQL